VGEYLQVAVDGGQEVLKALARRQHERADSLGVTGGEQLGDGAAGVVADDHGFFEIQRVEQFGYEVGDRGCR
jgi:hypothetical protein